MNSFRIANYKKIGRLFNTPSGTIIKKMQIFDKSISYIQKRFFFHFIFLITIIYKPHTL